jgi:hypothetical protein
MEHGGMKEPGPLSEGDKRRLVLKLVAQLRCVECGRLYDRQDFTLIHNWQDMWVLSTRCRHCDEPVQVVIFMRLDAEPEPATDLTPEEAETAAQWPAITADDVLDIHTLLHHFEGDFEALFER